MYAPSNDTGTRPDTQHSLLSLFLSSLLSLFSTLSKLLASFVLASLVLHGSEVPYKKTRAPTVYGRQTVQIMPCRAFWPTTRTQD